MKDEENQRLVQKRKNLSQDYQKVFSSPAGKRVLFDLMAKNFVLQPTLNGSEGNSTVMDRNEGRREAVLQIMAQVRYTPEKLMKLLKESDENDEGDHV